MTDWNRKILVVCAAGLVVPAVVAHGAPVRDLMRTNGRGGPAGR